MVLAQTNNVAIKIRLRLQNLNLFLNVGKSDFMKSSNIGGQAVMEGIMMKNGDKYAVAVRKPDQEIEVKVEEYKGIFIEIGRAHV